MNNIESSPDSTLRVVVDEHYHANSENLSFSSVICEQKLIALHSCRYSGYHLYYVSIWYIFNDKQSNYISSLECPLAETY